MLNLPTYLTYLHIVLRATQIFHVLIFFSKTKVYLMSGLKVTLAKVASFLPDNLSGF